MPLLALTIKDLRLLLRDRTALFFTLGFPIVYAMMFGLIFGGGGRRGNGGPTGLPVVVVDEDRSAGSGRFVDDLVADDTLAVELVEPLSEAERLVRTGRRVAYVRIPAGFGAGSQQLFWGEPARIEVGVDPSRRAESGMLEGILTRHAYARFQEVFADGATLSRQAGTAQQMLRLAPGGSGAVRRSLDTLLGSAATLGDAMQAEAEDSGPSNGGGDPGGSGGGAGWQPVEVQFSAVTGEGRRGPTNAFAVSFPQAIVWGLMGCASAFAVSLVVERQRGTLVRLRAAPIPRWHVLLGKSGARFLVMVTVSILLLLLSTVLGVRIAAPDLPKLAVAVVAVAVAFVGIMMLVSVLARSESASGSLSWAVLVVMAIVGGGAVPLFLMPPWMQSLAGVSPIKWAILALEAALWRGYSWGEMALPCAVLFGVGVVGTVAGTSAFRWSD